MESFGSTSKDVDLPETMFWKDGLPIAMKPGTALQMNKTKPSRVDSQSTPQASKTSSWFSLKRNTQPEKETLAKESDFVKTESDLYNYF